MGDEQTNFAEIPSRQGPQDLRSAAPETLADQPESLIANPPAPPSVAVSRQGMRPAHPANFAGRGFAGGADLRSATNTAGPRGDLPSGDEAAESNAENPSESDVESRLDQKIRETESRLFSQFEQMIARVNQSNRDATKARFDELKAYFDQLYFVKAEGLDELVQSHQLDPTAAALQKLAWRERYDKEALRRAQQLAHGSSAAEAEQARFQKRVALVLDEYDLSMSDPEYQSDIAGKPLGNDLDEAEIRLRKMAKQAAKKKEARLGGVPSASSGQAPSEERRKEEPRSPKSPMLVDSGVSQRVPPLERKPKPTLEDADDLGAAILRRFTQQRSTQK